MKIKLDYGMSGIWVDIPKNNLVKVLKMKSSAPLQNPEEQISRALKTPIGSPPLEQIASGKKSACVVICDITRPVPNTILLPPILRTLEQSGIRRQQITILIATGIHRPNLGDELIGLVGEEIAANYRIVNHRARVREEQTYLGKTSRGTDVLIDSTYIDADLKITTGFIEPHLMAGF
ncbi:MAG: lactate racemase domain-containing protein, partial [bacterium]|nr:lactate racemase domain-containing protein [bacterium]